MMKTFSIGGIHPSDKKISKDCQIEVLPLPSKVFVSMAQHLGAPATPVVKAGDVVKVGQVIAEPIIPQPITAIIGCIDLFFILCAFYFYLKLRLPINVRSKSGCSARLMVDDADASLSALSVPSAVSSTKAPPSSELLPMGTMRELFGRAPTDTSASMVADEPNAPER